MQEWGKMIKLLIMFLLFFFIYLSNFGCCYWWYGVTFLFLCTSCKQEKLTVINYTNPTKDLLEMLIGKHRLNEESKKKVGQLRDLLDKMLNLDPTKRFSVNQSLTHPFITEKMSTWKLCNAIKLIVFPVALKVFILFY